MATYSQTKIVYSGEDAGGGATVAGEHLLATLFCLTAKAPGAGGLIFTGTGLLSGYELRIPSSPGGTTAADLMAGAWSWSRYQYENGVNSPLCKGMRRTANALFRTGRSITITSDHYSVYEHGSSLLFRPSCIFEPYSLLEPGERDYLAPP